MDLLIQQVVNGLANGALYATMGIAIVLVFRATGVVNFAQGEIALFTTFVAWQLNDVGIPYALVIPAVLAFSFVLGSVLHRAIAAPLRGKPELATVLVTLGLFLLINQVTALAWPGEQRELPSVLPAGRLEVAGVTLSVGSLALLVILGVEALALYAFFTHTRIGLRTRAAADNPDSAVLHGIVPDRMFSLGWGLAAVFGCLAGLLVAPTVVLTTGMMFPLLVYGLCAATLGGLSSPVGAVFGGLVLGVVENLAATYLPLIGTDLKIAVPLLLIFVTLLVKPHGVFGRMEVVRV
jgi:branched-chain amino acid transport system permease protein